MKIEWINHAGFSVSDGETRIVCDPWLEGRVFDQSWELISPSHFRGEDFGKVTHIWVSHQHPDHLSLSTLEAIPPTIRSRISFLYQTTRDKKVVQHCSRYGFQTICELSSQPLALSSKMQVISPQHVHGDSWLFIKGQNSNLLNLNDCNTTEQQLRWISKMVGPLDILVTQFSYANWCGNKLQIASRKEAARQLIKKLFLECEILRPKFIIPAASFIWFCHEENFHMNDCANRISDVEAELFRKTNSTPIVLYPGDSWNFGELNDNQNAIHRYEKDLALKLTTPILTKMQSVTFEILLEEGTAFMKKLKINNPTVMGHFLKPSRVYLYDLKRSLRISFGTLAECNTPSAECDVILGSGALSYAFRFPWGGETLFVNGRYEVPANKSFQSFYQYFALALENHRGEHLTDLFTSFRRSLRKVVSVLGGGGAKIA